MTEEYPIDASLPQTDTSLQYRETTPKSRLTVVEHVYHQSPDEEAFEQEIRYSRFLATDEQPFLRKLKVTEEWATISSGWLDNCSVLLIKNASGNLRLRSVTPSPQEVEQERRKVIQVAYEDSKYHFDVLVGETMRVSPSSLQALRIRCAEGTGRADISIIPE